LGTFRGVPVAGDITVGEENSSKRPIPAEYTAFRSCQRGKEGSKKRDFSGLKNIIISRGLEKKSQAT